MSYRCEECGCQVPPRQKLKRAVTGVRRKWYKNGSQGVEIITEKAVCAACSETMKCGGKLASLDGFDHGGG
jgi:hypothetical protein